MMKRGEQSPMYRYWAPAFAGVAWGIGRTRNVLG